MDDDRTIIRTQAECDRVVEEIKGLLGDARPEAQARFEDLLKRLEEYLEAFPKLH